MSDREADDGDSDASEWLSWNDDDGAYDAEDRDCFHCAGDGLVECPDPLECTRPHNQFGECPCGSCGGSGLAKDMTIW